MSRLNKVIQQNERTSLRPAKGKKVTKIPVYDMSGKMVAPEKKKKDFRLAVAILVVCGIFVFLYFPQFLMSNSSSDDTSNVKLDTTSIKLCDTTIKNNPSKDFDNDGVENSEEKTKGTSPYFIDSDMDGLSDYCELYDTKTNPTSADTDYLIAEQKKLDKKNGKSLSSPYKIGNVILWADDYNSKAYGSVVKTTAGYRFNQFDGYAQFPKSEGKYAYKLENGVRSLLSYSEDEGVYSVSSGDTVELYDKKLEMTVDFNIFGLQFYAPDNIFTDIANKILPNKGFITAEKKAKIDVEPDTRESVITDVKKPSFNKKNGSRFMMNSNTLSDLQNLRETIKEEDSCVAVSLYKPGEGEYLAIAYGYTYEGDILLADMNTKKDIGVLTITEKARKILNEDGKLVSYSYFDFKGFGFDSTEGDRISFFATSSNDSGNNINKAVDKQTQTDDEEKNSDSKNDDKKTDKTKEETKDTQTDQTSTETPTTNTTEDNSEPTSNDTNSGDGGNSNDDGLSNVIVPE